MCEETYQTNEDSLTIALRELDAAKEQLGSRQAELSDAARPSYIGCSPDTLLNFESRRLAMNEAAERYRRALGAFQVVCQKGRLPTICASEPNVLERRRVRSLVGTNSDAQKERLGFRKEPVQFSKPSFTVGARKESLEE
jgi:hypothetical protein